MRPTVKPTGTLTSIGLEPQAEVGTGTTQDAPPLDAAEVETEPVEVEDGLHIGRQLGIGLAMVLFMTVVTGIIYPVVITGVAQAAFPSQANGSLVTDSKGQVVGSLLLEQVFTDTRYF